MCVCVYTHTHRERIKNKVDGIHCQQQANLGRLGGSVGLVSAFGSGHDLRVLGSSPTLGSLLSRESASPSALPLLMLFLSVSQINQ